ncbi:MAG: D-inositol-3-phosphate glycosyltransferase, partial [Cellulomonadaceae bacterium]
PGHDPERWARELRDLLADDVGRARLAAGAADVGRGFGWDRAAHRMLEVYDRARRARAAAR